MSDSKEKGRILKESLLIVDKLGGYDIDDFDVDDLEDLIDRARKLKRNRLWRLK